MENVVIKAFIKLVTKNAKSPTAFLLIETRSKAFGLPKI